MSIIGLLLILDLIKVDINRKARLLIGWFVFLLGLPDIINAYIRILGEF